MQTVEREWGKYTILFKCRWLCIKMLHFLPRRRLSMQRHFKRYEWWYVLKGIGCMFPEGLWLGNTARRSFLVKPEQWHQFASIGIVRILEVQFGSHVTEDDIERRL